MSKAGLASDQLGAITHAHGPDGYDAALCGLAYEEMDPGMECEGELVANPGAVVTCDKCRRIIDYGKRFRAYRQPRTEA